ncbi:MAG: hypothetical protein AAGG07_00610 [Planctomycetota bacterium]
MTSKRWRACMGGVVLAMAAGTAQAEPDWVALEAPLLTDHVQLTTPDRFVKAGEAYFNADSSWIIFQAIPVPPAGQDPVPNYLMYAAELRYEGEGSARRPVGLGEPILLSPEGSANTCGWFHPTRPGVVLFGSTLSEPVSEEQPGFQVGSNRYVWQFHRETEIVEMLVPEIASSVLGRPVMAGTEATTPRPIFERDGYDAEGSWSSDGRYILYAHVRQTAPTPEPDADLWLYDMETGAQIPVVEADGYDGGPFFSPSDTRITYRSDRIGDDKLQIYVSELSHERTPDGLALTGLAREVKLTANDHVNWAPYWHPDEASLVYTTSEVSHFNYEIFGIDADTSADAPPPERRQGRRVTFAEGFDGLSVFNPDGRLMMWTSQRTVEPDGTTGVGASQLWIANVPEGVTGEDFFGALSRTQAKLLAERHAAESGVRGEVSASRAGRAWIVTIRPQGFGGESVYRVQPSGTVSRLGGSNRGGGGGS